MGGQVVRQLLAQGDRVRAFVLRGDPGVKVVPREAEVVEGDVRDLARGIILAADKGAAGAGYILGNEEITFRQFAEIVAEESGCKKIRTFLPIWAANGMAVCMEAKAKLTGGKPLMTRFSICNLARNNAFDSSRAKRELGYTTRSCRETIRDEIAWMKDAGLIANPTQPVYNGVRKAAAAH